MRSSPNDLQIPLRLELDDANLQHLIKQDRGLRVSIRRLQDFSDHLVQRALQNLARLACVGGGCEAQFDRVVAEVLANLLGKLVWFDV